MRTTLLLLLLSISVGSLCSQSSTITLEDIWRNYTYAARSVPGFNFLSDGKHYTRLERNKIEQYNLLTGQKTATLLDATTLAQTGGFPGTISSYSFSDDEQNILIATDEEPIYRHSSKAFYWIYNREEKTITPVFERGKHRLASLNPQGNKVAFVFENNLYYKDLTTGQIRQITSDGLENAIINGATDWVYEEEFSFDRGFYWSPDGEYIAFYRFDEREVPEFTMTNYYNNLYPENVTFKYPKVGASNSKVSVHIYTLATNQTVKADTGDWEYIPRIKWTRQQATLCIFRMNRHQNLLELLLTDATTAASRTLLREENKYYIDIHDNLTFLRDGKHFIWSSEQSGWNHLYMYDMNGRLVKPLTQGNWEVSEFYGYDEANDLVFYQAAKVAASQREIYAQPLMGKGKERTLSTEEGWNSAQFSATFDYFVLNYSNINTPPTYTVFDRNSKRVRLIEDNAALQAKQDTVKVAPVEFFNFTTSEQVQLNGFIMKPARVNPTTRYPVLMFVYGGPGSQQVTDNWKGQNYWWFQMLVQQGFVVACVDNRGTGGRGEDFKKMTYLQLGHYETLDQIEAAQYLAKQPFVDPARIGIFGWSYGGYMSSLCLLKGSQVFKAAIAVAPVTNWKWYDSIYTERYMRTAAENEKGYEDNSPVNFAQQLTGNYLLIHGMGDDNVHFQHTAEMANALIAANKQFDTYFYPNRNHGIGSGNARLHLYTKMTNFLHEYLKPGSNSGSKGPLRPAAANGNPDE